MRYAAFITQYFPTGAKAHIHRERLAPPGTPGKIPHRTFNRQGLPTPEEIDQAGMPKSMIDLGFSPFIGDGTMVQFGAIDIDDYDMNYTKEILETRAAMYNLPLTVVPSKTLGGFQMMMTVSEPLRANDIRACLRKMAVWMGFDVRAKNSKYEILPKQSKVVLSDGDFGTGIFPPKASQMDEVIKNTRTVDEWNAILSEGEFEEGAACLFPMLFGEPSEYRHSILYNYAIFARYHTPFTWEDKVLEKGRTAFATALPDKEIRGLISSLSRGPTTHYKCMGAPYEQACNKELCKKRKHGIHANSPVLSQIDTSGITVLDSEPPVWFITIFDDDGQEHRMTADTEQLYHVAKFAKRCLETIYTVPELPAQKDWMDTLNDMLRGARHIPVPAEMSESARLQEQVNDFLRVSSCTSDPTQIVKGRVYISGEEEMMAHFRLVDFHRWMEQARISRLSITELHQTMHRYSQEGKLNVFQMMLHPLGIEVYRSPVINLHVKMHIEDFFSLQREEKS